MPGHLQYQQRAAGGTSISSTSSKKHVPPGSLGDFEQLVLRALARIGDRAYGVTIHDEIVRRARRDVTVASVYKTLERLEDKGFVASTIGEPTAERGGRRKKYFRLQ